MDFIGVLPLVLTLNLELVLGEVFKCDVLDPMVVNIFSVDGDEVSFTTGLVLLIGCRCLTLNLDVDVDVDDDDFVDGITASVELSGMFSLSFSSPGATFCKLTLPLCLMRNLLLLMKLLLVVASVVV